MSKRTRAQGSRAADDHETVRVGSDPLRSTAPGAVDAVDRWAHIEELFHAAREKPASERRQFVSEACRDNERLREEVQSLLDATEGPAAFRDDAVGALARELAAESHPPSPLSGSVSPRVAESFTIPGQIGPYRLVDVLGHGGMGTVYLAEQGAPLPRQVALKLIRWGGEQQELLRRFEVEREAMARLSHPAVAQVFDAGTSADGQPYIVLEYIPGEKITAFCDARKLSFRARLSLFVAVCDGVRHAHEKGVIHRDLKPSNILVTETKAGPRPKIIDFGIAKALEPWSEAAAETTSTRLRIGSPGYMSPEAAIDGGRGVDTRSDVYSLGIVLFELLTGVRPFDSPPVPTNSRTWHEVPESPRPSQRLLALDMDQRRAIAERRQLDEKRMAGKLRGELDWIAKQATQADPSARYGTAAELAFDVERWLSGRPVQARPPSFSYRAGKFLRRHAIGSSAAVLLLATIIGFGVRSNVLYARAEAERVRAEELVSFMLDDLSAQLEPRGRLDMLEAISRKSLEYFENSAGSDLAAAGNRPALALRKIGRVLATRGDLDAATAAYERAREIDEKRVAQLPDDPSVRLDLVADLELLSRLRRDRGELRASQGLTQEAETILRGLVRTHPDDLRTRRGLGAFLVGERADLARSEGQAETARSLLHEGQEILQSLRQEHPKDLETRRQIAESHYMAGLLAMISFDDPVTAIEAYGSAIEIFRALATEQPESATWRYRLAVLQGQGLATANAALGRYSEAQDANEAALVQLERLTQEEPENNRWAHALGWELMRKGEIATSLGDSLAAVEAFRRAVAVQEGLIGRTVGSQVDWLDALALANQALANSYRQAGKDGDALQAAESALEVRRRIATGDEVSFYDQIGLAEACLIVSELRALRGDTSGARALFGEARGGLENLADVEFAEPWMSTYLAEVQGHFEELAKRLPTETD